jgi:hypothetical protein
VEEEQKSNEKTEQLVEEEDEYMTDLVPMESSDEKENEIETKQKTINEFLTSHYKNIDGDEIFNYVYDPVNGV